jgi:translation elongation factor EF-Tu-like GTPase
LPITSPLYSLGTTTSTRITGSRFAIREGGRTVGAGVITSIIK